MGIWTSVKTLFRLKPFTTDSISIRPARRPILLPNHSSTATFLVALSRRTNSIIKNITRKASALIIGCGIAAGSFGSLAGVANASSPHSSALKTNSGCSWDGYHKYTNGSSITADTEKKSGNCVEVSVALKRVGGTAIWQYNATKAVASVTGAVTFEYSDHNADPLGTAPYVGFRMT